METARPQVSVRSGPSLVWLIPLLTALVGGWLVIKTLREQGPEVTISFKTAEGIEVGKTRIKYKNLDIGIVERIGFSEDLSNVIVTGKFNQGTEEFFRRNTRFWVVRPQLSLRGASGLSTLISGAYIEIEPGKGAPQLHFVGLEEQPVVTADEEGVKVVLISDRLSSVDTGSPVYYRGIKAGEVLGHELGNDSRTVFIHAFIKRPYDQMVRGNTRFWNVSGLDVSMDADGLRVHTESVESLMFGGIAFETPETLENVSDDVSDIVFTLYDTYEQVAANAYTRKLQYVMFFDNSVRGLSVGAPVEFKGIKVGSVLDIRLEFDAEDTSFRIPVLVEIEPERIVEPDSGPLGMPEDTLVRLVDRGLRARLQTGSLLTGQLYVELAMEPERPVVLVGSETRYPELPTIGSANLESITQTAERFMSRLDKVRVDEVGGELLATLKGANKIANSPDLEIAIVDLRHSLQSLRGILARVDDSNLQQAINAGHVALDRLATTLALTNRLLDPNSPLHYNLIQATGELEETARSIRSLVDTLERHPQAVIFGKEPEGETP
ncbi:MAG: MCE family protein [Gammaproteobacteria bacterium]|nr:MCE family protein [Gammaproteobacteria bacterium]